MRRWGIIVSALYAAVVLGFLVPSIVVLARLPLEPGEGFQWWLVYTAEDAHYWLPFIIPWALMLIGGQALLLFLSVDTSWRRFKPRRHIAFTAALTGMMAAFLIVSCLFSLALAVHRKALDWLLAGLPLGVWILIVWAITWIAWGFVFYRYYRGSSKMLERVVSWLLRGSVLELMIAVPAHVIVRSRGDCSAPLLTGWGIVTGLAIMLMCFGPGVLALYRKRIASYGPAAARRAER